MKIRLFSAFFISLSLLSQTQINPTQIGVIVSFAPPRTETFFADPNQVVYFLAPGTNRIVTKVNVYRNGLRQSDFPRISPPARIQDYIFDAGGPAIIFKTPLVSEDIIIVDYWYK